MQEHATTGSRPLKVLIVGAGIGGLSAALAIRQQGHEVTLFETSKFSNETGAALHIAPNCNGLLRRMGLDIEKIGANPCVGVRQYSGKGDFMFDIDLKGPNQMWQHPWLLVHRAHLHTALRERATGEAGKGKPAKLCLSSRVASVDPVKAEVTLENGEKISGDIVVGADGVHSRARQSLPIANIPKPFDSGKSAYRFLVPKEKYLDDPNCKELVQREGYLIMAIGKDRRVIMYPCVNNTLLNFVLIHPSKESQSNSPDQGWNQGGSKDRMMEIYKDFGPTIRALLEKADEDTLKIWTLLDMEVLPTWISERMALLGDAAHPFLPHQGQGGAQAIEDAVSLAALLPLGTSPDDVSDRVKLYEKCRLERAHKIQEFTRIAGEDEAEKAVKRDPKWMMEYTAYNFGHDEWDASTQALRKHLQSTNAYRYRMPLGFGPAPGPRQPLSALPDVLSHSQESQTTASIRFASSRTFLQNLFPTAAFSFTSPATVAQASIVCSTLAGMKWLGGGGYTHCGLYIHGVQYKKSDGEVIHGTYLAVLFENLADPIITGREELGFPKMFCDIDIDASGDSTKVKLGWRGKVFGELEWNGLAESNGVAEEKPAAISGAPASGRPGGAPAAEEQGLMIYKYIPAVGEPGKADVEYAVLVPKPVAATNGGTESKSPAGFQPSSRMASKADIKFDGGDWDSLPTLHNVAQTLAEVPIYKVLEAKVEKTAGVSDVRGARRIE